MNYINLWQHIATVLVTMRNVSDRNCIENQNIFTHVQ